ncbi:MAG: hypothetical protein U1A27_11195 [Phycisphaerae bacterium]
MAPHSPLFRWVAPVLPTRHWRRFCVLAAVLFAVRGLVVLCVLAPDEGWDEYQHVGYVVFMHEQQRPPRIGQDVVPRSLLARQVDYPHPDYAIEQIGRTGARDYKAFFAATQPARFDPAAGDIPLYQAQHPPLYYRVVGPLFRAAGGLEALPRAITTLRAANLLIATIGVWLAMVSLGECVRDRRTAALLALLVALQPVIMMNSVRISSDALAFTLAVAAIRLCLRGRVDRPMHWAAAGGLIGVAILTKTVHLSLLPFAGAVIGVEWLRGRARLRQAAVALAALLVPAAALVGPSLAENLRQFGSLTLMQEAIANRAAGRTTADILGGASHVRWGRVVRHLWIRDPVWAGGWSFAPISDWAWRGYQFLTVAGLAGWLWRLRPGRSRGAPRIDGAAAFRALLLVAAYTASLCYYVLHAWANWGGRLANTWYVAAVLPSFLLLVVGGMSCWRGRHVAGGLLVSMVATYALVPLLGVRRLIAIEGATASLTTALARLATLHPAGLGATTVWAGLVAMAVVLVAALAAVAVAGAGDSAPGERQLADISR